MKDIFKSIDILVIICVLVAILSIIALVYKYTKDNNKLYYSIEMESNYKAKPNEIIKGVVFVNGKEVTEVEYKFNEEKDKFNVLFEESNIKDGDLIEFKGSSILESGETIFSNVTSTKKFVKTCRCVTHIKVK